ncbi:hypothetical protein F5Y10DRAFT_287533 [Nemania abortiva]|nr:hypothetical protein F5Y10DRAFT_287533 [Nemania abortiva]
MAGPFTPVVQQGPRRVVAAPSPAALFRRSEALGAAIGGALLASKTWDFEKILGFGSYGVTVLLIAKDPLRIRKPRRAVLKWPLTPELFGTADFLREANILSDLRGHAHIGQLINYTDDVAKYRPRNRTARGILKRVLETFKTPSESLFRRLGRSGDGSSPAMLLEYLENGTLAKVVEALYYNRFLTVPNRLLWAWYHCLVSACVAMTIKKEGREGGPLELEQPRRDGTDHYRLSHRDIAGRNVMLGTMEPDVFGHLATPKLVMIDFGMARQLPAGREKDSEDENLTEVNRLMLDLVDPRILANNRGFYAMEWNGMVTMAAGLFNRRALPNLDPELRQLLAESFLVEDSSDGGASIKPSLRETFRRTREGMQKGRELYQNRINESDEYIKGFLQRLALDARDPWP